MGRRNYVSYSELATLSVSLIEGAATGDKDEAGTGANRWMLMPVGVRVLLAAVAIEISGGKVTTAELARVGRYSSTTASGNRDWKMLIDALQGGGGAAFVSYMGPCRSTLNSSRINLPDPDSLVAELEGKLGAAVAELRDLRDTCASLVAQLEQVRQPGPRILRLAEGPDAPTE